MINTDKGSNNHLINMWPWGNKRNFCLIIFHPDEISHNSLSHLQNKFVLIDFNPYCPATDPLLFSWDELTPNKSTEKLLLPTSHHSPSSPPSHPLPPHTQHTSGSSSDLAIGTCDGPIDGDPRQHQLLPVFRIVDGESIQPSDLHSFRLPKVTAPRHNQ